MNLGAEVLVYAAQNGVVRTLRRRMQKPGEFAENPERQVVELSKSCAFFCVLFWP